MARALVALLVGATVSCSSADFLASLQKKVHARRFAQQTPAQIGQAVAKAAAGAVKTANAAASSAEASGKSAEHFGMDAVQQGKQVADTLRQNEASIESRAKNAGQRVADNIHTVASEAASEAAKTADEASRSPQSVMNFGRDAVQEGKQAADKIRQATPAVTGAVSQTEQRVEQAVQTATHHGGALVNGTGESLSSATTKPDSGDPGLVDARKRDPGLVEEREEDYHLSKITCLAAMVGALSAGYFVSQRFKQRSVRSPILLSDALDGVATDQQSRGGLMQMSSVDEPGFSRF